jgi:crotonobetainyl-CoA:carnitine CoA-transferase CaiB-like acyl-CoA transferase
LDGPYSGRKAFDMVVQAASGIMSLTANERGEPRKIAMSIADLFGACSAALGTVAALLGRRRGGSGSVVDCALFDVAVWITQDSWRAPRSAGTMLAVRDGYLVVDDRPEAARRLADVLSKEPPPATMGIEHVGRLCWANGIPTVVPLGIHAVATAPHTWARRLLTDVNYDGHRVRVIGSPFKFSRSFSGVRRAAPTEGRDSAALLTA